MGIPFVKEFDYEYGKVEQVSPLIRRVVANNPGPFTFVGTGVYIIGHGEVAVIDPGPELAEHFDVLKDILKDETVTHVLVTHGHSDHSPLAQPLAEWAGCKTYAKNCGVPTAKGELGSADDLGFQPDVKIGDGDVFSGPGWTIDVIETPGHTCNHVCFGLREENACLTGDHIMGWSTTIVAPPDGNMADYIRSLDKIEALDFGILWPTHGSPVREDVSGFIQAYRQHRHDREAALVRHLKDGETDIPHIVSVMYADVDKRLHPAAAMSILGHMLKLVDEGYVETPDASPTVRSEFRWKALRRTA